MLLSESQVKKIRFLLKSGLKSRYPGIKSSHITEAFAQCMGYNTNASFIARNFRVASYDRTMFYSSLAKLSNIDIIEPDGYDIVDYAYISVSQDYLSVSLRDVPLDEIAKRILDFDDTKDGIWTGRMVSMVTAVLGSFLNRNNIKVKDISEITKIENIVRIYNSKKDNQEDDLQLYMKSILYVDIKDEMNEISSHTRKQHKFLRMQITANNGILELLGYFLYSDYIIKCADISFISKIYSKMY